MDPTQDYHVHFQAACRGSASFHRISPTHMVGEMGWADGVDRCEWREHGRQVELEDGWLVTQIACGREHAAVVAVPADDTNGRARVLTWGDNQRGQLGRSVSEHEDEEDEQQCGVIPRAVSLPGANPIQVRMMFNVNGLIPTRQS
jgi:hypothetical protein